MIIQKKTPLLDRLFQDKNFEKFSDWIIKLKNIKSKKREKVTGNSKDFENIDKLE